MTERPILFSGPMVRAILDGRKTQTHRVIMRSLEVSGHFLTAPEMKDRCPYGQAIDRLWVRETWYCDDFEVLKGPYKETENAKENLYYRSDDPNGSITNLIPECDLDGGSSNVWKPSIHMPRWASRLTLEITDIRVQRVQDISEEDSRDEGAAPVRCEFTDGTRQGYLSHREGFKALWNSINDGRGFGWNVNPWVWAISFRRVE